MAEDTSRRLGRGLAALIGEAGDDADAVARARAQRSVPIEFLRPNPRNPRKSFGESDLEDLAGSIREKGILQPIVVRAIEGLDGVYEIIAGERRWRAAQRAGLHEVPILQIEATEKEALELAIIENVQRADLNALEEAAGYEQLMSQFAYSQNDLAQVIGKSRSHVANTLRLMKLPEPVRAHLMEGRLSAGHGRALLGVRDPEGVARVAIEKHLTVRDIERIAQREAQGETAEAPKPAREKDPDTRALEQVLEDVLGLKVSINHKGQAGELKIAYKTLEQLDGLCQRLRG